MPHSSDALEIHLRLTPPPREENGVSWLTFLQRVAFRFAPLGIHFNLHRIWAAGGRLELYMGMNVPDVNSGQVIHISRYQVLPPFPGDQAAALQLRTWAAALLLHELDEQFELDGIRVFDPHDPARAIR